ncbi:MAG: MFS transporter [Sphingomonadaceae bacterium]|nr:MFS transporter [Sphingomonadaceae bacterium]
MKEQQYRPILAIVALIVFVDMVGIGLILPVMPQLVGEVAGTSISTSAEIGGMLLFAYAVMQFLFASFIGGLSDRYGRRPVLLITLTALGLDYVIMALAPTLTWLVAGRAISGVMGASWAAANSCVADAVPVPKRGAAFGLLGGAGAAGFVLGPAIGGVAGEWSTRLPFVIAATLALSGAVAGYFLLKETLPPERRRRFSAGRANPFGTLLQAAKTPFVFSSLVTIFFMQLSAQAQMSIWAYWGELTFGWTPLVSGSTIAFYGVMIVIMQALIVGRMIERFGAAAVARWSLLLGLPSYALLATATSTGMVLLAIVVGSFTGLTFPAMQSLMTQKISEDSQGELQGGIASVIGLTAIIGPLMMTQIFGHFTDQTGLFLPGAPYLLSMILLTIAILTLWRAYRTN